MGKGKENSCNELSNAGEEKSDNHELNTKNIDRNKKKHLLIIFLLYICHTIKIPRYFNIRFHL